MPENQFSKRMRDKLEALGVKCYRIESAKTQTGIPDIHYVCKNGVAGWIETKQVDQPVSRMPYEPTQALWLDEYARAGGRCCTILHVAQLDLVNIVWGRNSLMAAKRLNTGAFTLDLTKKDAWVTLANLLCDTSF